MYADICSWWCMYICVVHESSHVFGGGCVTCIYYGELGIYYFLVVFGGACMCMWCMYPDICSWWCMWNIFVCGA